MFDFLKSKAPPPAPSPEIAGGPYPDVFVPVAPPPPPESRFRKWMRRVSRGFAIFAVAFILLVGWLALTAPLSKSLQPIAPPEITLLASDGTPIARMGAIVDAPVDVAKLPKHVPGAFIAIEDRRFYSHWGVDPRSVARAVWANLTGGRKQGGSTITQQLAKFTFLTPKKTLGRKAREALIAFWLEAWLTKDEILERYLSNAYFGDNTYGLRAASLHYFSRQPEKLTSAQAAMLAGLVQAPSRLAPTKNPDLAEKRMRLVVDAMADTGYLTAAEAKAIRAPRIDVRSRNTLPTGTYFADWALPEARQLSDVGYSRQTIRTTLDARLQGIARRVTARAGLGKAQVAMVAMRPNGEVVAMVGGRDYAASPFNRVTQARRQPGSTFKLFVYLAALEDGKTPEDLIDNRPIDTGAYQPKNAGGAYSDTITLEDAFAASSNVAAVRLFREVGDDKVIRMARDLGVTAPLAKGDPSLALGTSSMTLLELTAAYAAVAANSYPVVPHAFTEEEPGWFARWLWGPDHFSSRVHDDIEQMLRAAVNRGTGRAARLPQANFGKTGTTQDSRDALFVGYANGLVVGVWIGNDDNSPLHGAAGGGIPARIWRDFMLQASGRAAAPARKERPVADPGGPVQPLDIPDIPDVPIADKTSVGVKDGNAVISTEIGGTKIDLKLPIGDRAPVAPPQPQPQPAPQ